MTGLELPSLPSAWRHFVEQGQLDPACVSETVAQSWIRSASNGVDPFNINDDDILTQRALRERVKQNKMLIEIAEPVMRDLYGVIRGTGFTVLLTDAEGYILTSLGDPDFVAKAQKIIMKVGANWNEAVRGTNAIGTALATEQPIRINGCEHFCRDNQFLGCYAAPIYGPEGKIAGVLDVSGDYQRAHPHTLAAVVSAASLIQNHMILVDTKQQLILACHRSSAIMESSGDGYICVDRNGLITHMNHSVARFFGKTSGDCIGRPFYVLLGEDRDGWTEMMESSEHLEKALQQRAKQLGLTYTVRSLRDDRGRWFGAVAAIKQNICRETVNSQYPTKYAFADIIGQSPNLIKAKKLAETAAQTDLTVLLQGETGTGKEVFAQSIHCTSPRCSGPFIAINCGALPRTLIESELFGYDAGAFTGARRGGQAGKFELAHNGTIFLDEIGEMPLEVQASLLRVLENRQITRIGGQKIIPVNIRIIAATNKDLAHEVELGNFRADLYFRLNVFSIDIPRLCERGDDIIALGLYFMQTVAGRMNKTVNRIAPEVEEIFSRYAWPGNVRELENVIERAISIADGPVITTDCLPEYLKKRADLPESVAESELNLRQLEEQAIVEAMKRYQGNISQVARAVGIGRNTLYRKIKAYNLDIL